MMRFAAPAGLWLLALAVPILVLHVLRPRRQTREVSSTFLWQALARPVSAASPWQRLRASLLLLVQLLAVVLLAFAVAQPVRTTTTPLSEHTVFIVDASGSMAARDGSPDRLAAAKAEARDLRGELPAGGVASIVVASDRPRVVLSASPEPGAFAAALGPVETTAGGADWAGAFLLAESLETPGAEIGFEILSDGGLTDAEQRLLPPGSHYVRIGDRSANRAVTALVVEPRGSGLHARVTVANTGGPAATQAVRVDVDGHTEARLDVTVGEGDVTEVEVDLPPGDRVEAFLGGEDLLDADDHAFATAGRRRALRVLVAGPPDPFLETLLAASPGVTVERSTEAVAATGFDLAVYDRVAVPADPGAPFLAVAPPDGATGAGVAVVGSVERPAVSFVAPDDPLVDGLDFSEVAIASAQRLDAPGAATVLGAEGTPLLVRGADDGLPFAYLGFALGDSNLALQLAYPVLFDRLLTELAGTALAPTDMVVGDTLPVDPGTPATLTAPGGTTTEIVPGGPAPTVTRPGFWTIAAEGRPDRVIAVNADPAESVLAPAPSLLTPARQERPGETRPRGQRPVLAWLVPPLLAVLALEWLLARRRAGVGRRQWRLATALRLAVALLAVGALLDLAVIRRADRVATVLLVDGSDSLGSGGRAEAVDWTRQALAGQPAGAVAGVALFGGDARLELTVQADAELGQPAVRVDAGRTNLANALRLAAAVLPGDARRRVVVVSDGRATEGDAVAEAERLAAAGIEVEYHLVGRQGGTDVAVAALDVPGLVRQGESFTVAATVSTNRSGPVQLSLVRDGEVVDERVVELAPGESTVEIPQAAGPSGMVRYQLRVAGSGDAVAENDVGYAAVQVEGAPTVLVAEGAAGNGAALADALRAGGLSVDVAAAASLPPLDRLAAYAAVVLVDVDVRSLTDEQVATLAASSRDLGHGLLSIGGTHSYGLGGYLGSELEQILPVISEVTDPQRRQSVAEVLAIDSSGSMGACHCAEGQAPTGRLGGGVEKTDIARAAAARTIEALGENDEIGVLALNTERRWVIDLQELPPDQVVNDGLTSIQAQGGTDLRLSLQTAAEELRASQASLKHIILFTDGFTDPSVLGDLAGEAADLLAEGITVSVLATGEGAARELEAIAEAGGGRFYPGRDLQQIPQIMMEEAVIASRDFVTEGEFVPEVVSSDAAVRDLTASPPLLGYVATTVKPAARALLRIGPDHDPLLASWQLGLGTVTSWTSDAGERWAAPWASWDGYVGFWTAVVKDTFAAGDSAGVRARVDDGVLRVTVEREEAFPDGTTAVARVTGPDLEGDEVRLDRADASTFSGEVPVTDAGSYAVGVVVSGPDGTVLNGSTLASQSYAAEYQPGEPDRAGLERLAALTGSRGAIEPAEAFDAADLRAGRSRVALAGWFLLAAALVWPVAVAVSRLSTRGAVTAGLRRPGAWALWGLRSALARVPTRPGGRRAGRVPVTRPARARGRNRPREGERESGSGSEPAVPAPPPTLGRLLDRKRGSRSGGGDPRPS